MIHSKNILFLLFLTFFTFISAYSQDEIKVKISGKKSTIDGKQFYIHTVKKGETLYAISKAYNVPQKDIVMENPDAIDLKPDMALKIPVVDDKDKFTYHTIEKGQTLYSISKKYNTGISEIQKHNPAIENGLKVGMILKIPNKVKTETKTEEKPDTKQTEKKKEEKKIVAEIKSENTDIYITHTVEKGQTVFGLLKKYNISESQLKEANPELQGRGLREGDVLNIPKTKTETDKQTTEKTEKETPEKKSDTSKKEKPQITNTACEGFDYKAYGKSFKIALLAPFNVAQNRGYVLKGKKKDEEPPVYPKSLKFIEFYQGMLMAADSLKKAGLSIDLFVYDTEKDSAKIAAITRKKEFEDIDLIIGPFYSSSLKHFSDFAKNNNVPIVSPLSQNEDFLTGNPYAFHVNSSILIQITEAANHFSNSKDINYITINSGKKDDSLLTQHFRKKLFEYYNVKFKTDSLKYKEVVYREVGFKGVQDLLDKETDNVIFIPAVGETFVANILNKLNTLETKFPVYVLGMPGWATEDNIENDYLFNLQYTTFSSMYIDYKNPNVVTFLSNYRSIYSTEPTKYSFHGFDILVYFLNALKTYGKNFPGCIADDTKINRTGLQTEFNFKKLNENSGFENYKTYIIQYDKEFNIINASAPKKE
ncbi:MAG: LysM peptidoglycan-binding domain-containing protein [Bacteroidia bacterium]|nr:LysM peptidoglycan-binding domain-containing protein [Bacteroidia bacterium]